MSNYQDFALSYDVLTQNVDYQKRGDYLLSLLHKNNVTNGILVDLGCGTGTICEYFAQKGFDVIGVDNSEEMLNIAQEKKIDNQNDIIYLNQPMQELDLFGTVEVIISTLDSINHLIKKDDLYKLFERVSLFLDKNGLFIFDVNTIYKHQEILANNTFIYDCDEVYCVWQNSLLEDNIVKIDLDLFEYDDENDSYTRYSESFCEKAYSHEEILDFAKKAKLDFVSVFDDDSFDSPKQDSQRIVYVFKNNFDRLPPQNDII